jgi:acyl carrier protein
VEDKRDLDMDLKEFANIVIDQTTEGLEDPQRGLPEEAKIGPHAALKCRVKGRMDGVRLFYLFTLVDTGESLCQIICWTGLTTTAEKEARLNAIAQSFAVLPAKKLTVATEGDVAGSLRTFIAEHLGVDVAKVTPEAKLTADLGADELDLVEIILIVEEEYNVEVPDQVAEGWQTVGDVMRYVEKHHAPAKAKPRK